MEHGRLLAALRAEHLANAMAIATPGVELELEAADATLEGVDEDAFAFLWPNGARFFFSHESLLIGIILQ
jgi:hypothetical protein